MEGRRARSAFRAAVAEACGPPADEEEADEDHEHTRHIACQHDCRLSLTFVEHDVATESP